MTPAATTTSMMIPTTPVDDLVQYLCRMCYMIDQPTLTMKFIQLAIQSQGIGTLPEHVRVRWLTNVCTGFVCKYGCLTLFWYLL
jgi:hypothetical protein